MMTDQEKSLLLRIGALIRGDWSGQYFDGRNVRDWIQRVVDGKALDELDETLKAYERLVYS